jgi:predicted dehydrogenase
MKNDMNPTSSSISRRDFLHSAATATAAVGLAGALTQPAVAEPARGHGQSSVFGLKFPPMEKVRVGIIGVGGRGSALVHTLLDIEKVEIKALCDIVPERVKRNQQVVTEKGRPEPAGYTKGETDYENLCRRDDVDLVYIDTPWEWHVPMAVCAMKNGRHAAVEVPAATTLEGCWELVNTAERTQRHCMMLENCCYGETEMLFLNMVRLGLLGELVHGEAGYLHDLRDVLYDQNGEGAWRRSYHSRFNGNLYPTHGLGPVAQYLGINGGDKFDYLVSLSSLESSLSKRRDTLPAGDPRRSEKFVCGDMNTTLIKTALGRSVMVQHATTSPHPYSRINLISGTGGILCDYPPRVYLDGQPEDWDKDMQKYHEKYGHPLWKRLSDQAKESGGHGGMDFVLNWRLAQCLLEGGPLDMTVYDAAAWSSVFPLSVASVKRGSAPVEFPDFTRGEWKHQPPLGIIGAIGGPR